MVMAGCCHTDNTQESVCSNRAGRFQSEWLRLGGAALVAGQSMVFGLAVNMAPPEGSMRDLLHWVLALAAVIVFLLVGGPLLRQAWQGLRMGRINVEQFFLLGMLGAFGASVHSSLTGAGAVYYEVVAVLLAIYTLGSVIGRKRREAAQASAVAFQREFATATVRSCCGSENEVAVSEVRAGDHVVVRPGGAIPVDGIVVEGSGYVREAAVTGEAYPVVKRSGDAVVSGSHSVDALLVLEATAGGGARALDRLMAAVHEAQSRPSDLQREADRIVAWFLPAVLTVSALTFIGWTWHSGWVPALFNALAVILIACPCAMGLATPIGVWSALGYLAKRGILCKSGEMVERFAQSDTVVFDKTGTLSEDELGIADFVCADGVDRSQLQAQIDVVQQHSDHPVARAFRKWASVGQLDKQTWSLAGKAQVIAGVGVTGELSDDSTTITLRIGNEQLVGDSDVEQLREQLLIPESQHAREIFIMRGKQLAGLAVLRESVRESAAEAVSKLREHGLRVLMMTGDTASNAAAMRSAGVEEILAGLTPEQKAAQVDELKSAGAKVCFVGDGTNDVIALSRAQAGVAMASGTALAGSSAGAEMFGSDLRRIPEAIELCRRTVQAIHGNLRFAACYNIVGMVLAAAGVLNPIVAALIMLVSSVTVTCRALSQAQRIQNEAEAVTDSVDNVTTAANSDRYHDQSMAGIPEKGATIQAIR